MSKPGRILLSGGLILASGAYVWWDHAATPQPVRLAAVPVTVRKPAELSRPAPQAPAPLPATPPQIAEPAATPGPTAERKTQKPKPAQTASVAPPPLPAAPPPATPPLPEEPLQAVQSTPPPAVSTGRYADGEFVGDSIDTEWGPIQVKVVVRNGDIVDAICIIFPIHRQRSEEISAWAIPILREEAIKAQSEKVDLVSQASFTTEGYQMSLASALTRAAKK